MNVGDSTASVVNKCFTNTNSHYQIKSHRVGVGTKISDFLEIHELLY